MLILINWACVSFASEEPMKSLRFEDGNARAYWTNIGTQGSHWLSYLWACEEENIEHSKILESFGDKRADLERGLSKYATTIGKCSPSSDGLWAQQTSRYLSSGLFRADSSLNARGIGGPWVSQRLRNFAASFISGDQVASSSAIKSVLTDCGDRVENHCPAYQLLALFFAYSNSLSAEDRHVSAAQWRWVALRQSIDEYYSRRMVSAHDNDLVAHAQVIFNYASRTNDLGMAKMADGIIQKYSENDAVALAFTEKLQLWQQDFNSQSLPQAVVLSAVKDNPFSDQHSAILRYVTRHEFSINAVNGNIEFAQLECVDPNDDTPETSADVHGPTLPNKYQIVELMTDVRSGWTIPKTWVDCHLTILASPDTKVKIWEFPDGTLDRNGNPST
jgi:hypothetical protein